LTMTRKSPAVADAFEKATHRIAISGIQPLRSVTAATKRSVKYATIVASIKEVGIIEPPVVARDRAAPGKYLLLDGHLRLEVLKDAGVEQVVCLIATDDEAFTYNKRISRLAIVQEHRMIVKAVDRGVPEERLAKALNIDVKTLQQKKRLLVGICPEAAELLKDRHVSSQAFWVLKKMLPMRQIEAADLMIAMNKYTAAYAKSLLAATPQSQLADSSKAKDIKGVTAEQIALMERESANLEQEFKAAEQSYGTDHLHLVLAKGYLTKLLANAKVVRYLAQNHQEILAEFQRIAEIDRLAA
jgi:ParB-like chromosome segregation protein Spo0J